MEKLSIFLILAIGLTYVNCIMFNLHPNTQKCLKEEIQANQPVMGDYEITDAPSQKVDYIVCIF